MILYLPNISNLSRIKLKQSYLKIPVWNFHIEFQNETNRQSLARWATFTWHTKFSPFGILCKYKKGKINPSLQGSSPTGQMGTKQATFLNLTQITAIKDQNLLLLHVLNLPWMWKKYQQMKQPNLSYMAKWNPLFIN